MPNTKQHRHNRQRDEDANNNNAAVAAPAQRDGGPPQAMAPQHRNNTNHGARLQKCCTPSQCRSPDDTIDPRDPYDSVKVVCNNEACTEGVWMHKDCFEEFQDSVLAYLRSCGRARSWSEKQRLQNLWTKKGYDLAYKACDCKCSRGHLRKDLDYIPPPISASDKKNKKHKKKNDKPMPVVSTTHKSNSHNPHVGTMNNNHSTNGNHTPTTNQTQNKTTVTNRKPSITAITNQTTTTATKKKSESITIIKNDNRNDNDRGYGTTPVDNSPFSNSLPSSITSGQSISPNNNHGYFVLPASNSQLRLRTNSVSSTGSVGSHASMSSVPSSAGSISPISSSPVTGDMFFKNGRKTSESGAHSDTVHNNHPVSLAGFRQRLDLSAFACLPRNKQNAYHIRMEDSSLALAFHNTVSLNSFAAAVKQQQSMTVPPPPPPSAVGEEGCCDVETRNFVLTNLLNKRMCSTRCALCKTHLPVFDRFPLVDGTFFLSPQSYDEAAIQVNCEQFD